MSTVTKLGAYGLAVAAAFAVALAVLVTAPRSSVNAQDSTDNTPAPDTVIEAYTEVANAADDSDDTNDIAEFSEPSVTTVAKKSGESVVIQIYDLGKDAASTGPTAAVPTLFRFSVIEGGGASGTFKSGGGTALNCADQRTACDLDSDIDDLIVQFDIDDDAPDNSNVVIGVQNVVANKTVRVVISVTRAPVPVKFTAKISTGWPTSIPSEPNSVSEIARVGNAAEAATRGMTRIELKLEDKDENRVAQPLTIATSGPGGLVFAERGLGTPCGSAGSGQNSVGVVGCDARNFDGEGNIALWGNGRPGTTTVTFTTGDFVKTVDITLYGDAKTIEAAPEQNSVQVGGSVFIVVTVTDGAGNAVEGHEVTVLSSGDDAIQKPDGEGIAVAAVNTEEKVVTSDTTKNLPACNDGTNGKGKCVVQVTAPQAAGTANDATRGTHTITLQGSAPIVEADRKVKVDVTVAGPVDSIETNAPERVDLGSRTEIEVTLKDDAGVLAGAQGLTVTLVAGNGRVIGGGQAITSNGARSFTYRAASSPGTAEFDIEVRALGENNELVTAGKVLLTESISIAVGPAPEPPAPAQPTAAGISSNAPERVDPGSSTDITVTVRDADGDRAGMQSVTATKVSGDGRIINGGPAATTDGRYTFTFRAASTTGVTEIDVDVRSLDRDGAATTTGRVLATLSLTIQVGEPAPEMATLTPPPSGSGVALTAFSGGSLSDLQAVLLGECSSASVAAYATVGGNWVPYIPGARIAAVNAAFIAAMVTDGTVPAGTLLTVSGCD